MSSGFEATKTLTPAEKKKLRKRLFVDARVQGAMVLRISVYWLASVSMMAVLVWAYKTITCAENAVADMELFWCRA